MPRHRRAERFQLKGEIRVTGSKHGVVDFFFPGTGMAAQASLGLLNKVAGVVHADSQRLLVGPILDGVRAEPANGWTVAAFTTNAVVDGLKCLRTEFWL